MSRLIEFEAKTVATKEWIHGNLIYGNGAYNHFEVQFNESVYIEQKDDQGRLIKHLVIPETVGQFTNVIGTNGKRIYEHNIVSNGIVTGEVYWDYCYSGWKVAVENEKNILYGIDLDNTFRAIGRKYDSLIKGDSL